MQMEPFVAEQENADYKMEPNRKLDNCKTEGKMTWDLSAIDAMLYLVTPIATIGTAAILLLIPPPSRLPISISCYYPDQFDAIDVSYASHACLSKSNLSGLYLEAEQTKNPNFSVTADELFPATSPPSGDFSSPLFLIAILSLLPFLLWRLVGAMDGRDFLACSGPPSNWRGPTLFVWFLFTKVGSVALCGWLVKEVFQLQEQAGQYTVSMDAFRQTREQDVFCRFNIFHLDSSYVYTVQCQLFTIPDSQPSWEHLLQPVMMSLQTWFILLLVMHVVNLLVNLILLTSCLINANRILFIRRNMPDDVDKNTAEKLDTRLGVSGIFVAKMSARWGHGEKVRAHLMSYLNTN